MIYSLLENMKNIAVFMVICQTILHFTPSHNYEKYIKPVVGFMLLTKIIISVFAVFRLEMTQGLEESYRKYEAAVTEYEATQEEQFWDVSEFPAQINDDRKLNEELIKDVCIEIEPIIIGSKE
ncbi:MAG: stage III sporulation protein AF [Lachnospiraceae bacterium]|nr:stage III sporulation protein AF [Lachnospiraceae bacterium]